MNSRRTIKSIIMDKKELLKKLLIQQSQLIELRNDIDGDCNLNDKDDAHAWLFVYYFLEAVRAEIQELKRKIDVIERAVAESVH